MNNMSDASLPTMAVSESFIIALVGIGSASLGAFLSFILKSRCSKIKCCGLECDRQVISAQDLNLANIQIESSRA